MFTIRLVSVLLLFVVCNGVFFAPAVYASESVPEEEVYYLPDFDLQATSAIVINNNTGFILYEKNADAPLAAASLVKMVTALVVRSVIKDIDTTVVTAKVWVFNELFGKEASHADIWKGETLTVRELLYALLLPSANEAALMLAEITASGYVTNFVRMMNSKAASLGCTGTIFVDPTGISDQNITTARDMAIIVNAFLQDELLAEISRTQVYEMAAHDHPVPYLIHSTNRLLVAEDLYSQAYIGISQQIKGGKTGNLGDWQNFASVAVNNDVEYTVVVMQSPNSADFVGIKNELPSRRPALLESSMLYKWAFGNYKIGDACTIGQPIFEIPVKYSTQAASVHLSPKESLQTVLPKKLGVELSEEIIEKRFELPAYLEAPVEEGALAGYVVLSIQGRELGRLGIYTAKAIERNATLYAIQKTGEFFGTLFFKVFLVYSVFAVLAYVLLAVQVNKKKKRRAAKYRKK